ncbi:hypothetical protein EJ03DRAFT_348968 [Teratosphaeria nubilosa]|uniref:Uncharacterized protein n=1 Tax=Teratosphaeria nubilosa TaxID=161662 RepID=A0A6G1LGT1_9PEZI|nr:hypothetical protein EJ03DRAFT_348968 [Teratosphaeria nubilosa]
MLEHNANTMQFAHQINVSHKDPFTLIPVIITKGPLNGRSALLLEDIVPLRFLDLLLRQMIYRLLLQEPQQITIVQDKPLRGSVPKLVLSTFQDQKLPHKGLVFDETARKSKKQEPSPLAIMRVSKLLLQESAAVMYGENSFTLSETSRRKEFLGAIGSMRRNVRFVSVREHGYTASARQPAEGHQRLARFDMPPHQHLGPKQK